MQEKIEETVRSGKATIALGELPYTSRAKKVLEFAMAEARELNHSYVGTEHLLLGLLREEKGIAAQVLTDAGVTLETRARRRSSCSAPNAQRGAGGRAGHRRAADAAGKGEKKSKTPALDHFCRDLTELARRGPARPDHRPREGDRAGDGDPVAPQEEQSGADRRARRGQDRHRRRAGAAHRERRVPGVPARPPRAVARHGGRHRRHQVPRPVRGAAQGGHERDRAEQEHHPVHRRAAHARGRRRGRRRDRRVATCSSPRWRAASCSASAPRL